MYKWVLQSKKEECLGPVKWVKAEYSFDDRKKVFAYLEVPNGVHVLAEYQGLFALIRQFRPAVGDYVYELPGGGVEQGEEILLAACRELHEEIGLENCEGRILGTCRPSMAFSNEVTWLVHLVGQQIGPQHLESDEDITVEWVTLQTLKNLLIEGKLQQASAFAAIWLFEQRRSDC